MSIIKNNKISIAISIVLIILTILTTTALGLYQTMDFANEFAYKYQNANPKSVLGMTVAANRNLDESNIICIGGPDGTGAGPYNSSHRVVGLIDINYDGANTVTLYKEGRNPIKLTKQSNANEIKWFNAMAKAVAEARGVPGNNKYGAAFSKIMDQNLRSRFTYLLGTAPVPSVAYSYYTSYINECEKHGQEVLDNAIDDTFKVSKDYNKEETNCEYTSADTENVYVGPFKYSYKTKVNFGSAEIIGTNGKDTIYNETIKKVDKTVLFVKDGSGYKGVDSVNPETPFYVKANKKVDEANNVELKIKAKEVNYYSARIAILRSVGVPSQNVAVWGGTGKPSTSSEPIEYDFENNKGNLEIHKSGIYTSVDVNKVENLGFRLYYIENNTKKYVKIETDTKTVDGRLIGTVKINKQDSADQKDATEIYTDQNGDARIERIDSRYEYYIEEITNLTDYNTEVLVTTQKLDGKDAKETEIKIVEKGIIGPITVKKRSESEVTKVELKDAKKTGTLQLIKLDFDKTDKKISGVKFKVQNTETMQWIKADGADGVYNLKTYDNDFKTNKEYYKENYTSDESQATEFETNANGEITINGVDKGTYMFKEVYINNIKDGKNGKINYGYTEIDKPENVDSNYVFWSIDGGTTKQKLSDGEITLALEDYEKAEQSTVYVYNKKKYLKITGFVWEDMLGGKDNTYAENGENIYMDGDSLVDGISVRLIDKDGKTIKTETTKDGGKYVFEEVSREAIENGEYYVEFEYNGLTYTSVIPLVGDNRDINSKVGEVVEQRKNLNGAFAEITNKDDINNRAEGYSRDISGNTTGTITYNNDIANYQSIFQNSTYDNKTYSGLNLTANTNVTGFSLEKEFKEGRYIVDDSDAYVVNGVNLGIIKREQPQMSISNDIENVRIDVNGYSHTYYYSQRKDKVQDTSAFNVAVKFGKEYTSGYTRAIYPSDVKYSSTNATDANKLKVYVTYATTIRNMSQNLKMSLNELANYYDKEYTIVDSWIGDNESNKATWQNTSKYGQSYDDGKYKGAYTTSLAGTQINAGENVTVHITFQVSDKAVLGLLSENATLFNTSEVFSYSTYYGNDTEGCKVGEIYAGIDRASAPGNAKPGNKDTYEADTDDAPSLVLEAKGVRELAGTVFEDSTNRELQTGEERLGNGIYDEKENTVKDVTVELIKVSDGGVATIYVPEDSDKATGTDISTATDGRPAKMITGADGKYIFRGIEPDTYLIRYTYENGKTKVIDLSGNEVNDVTVQDYKSTIITSNLIKQAFENNEGHLDWYKTTETEGRHSDARDDYEAREKIDNEISILDGKNNVSLTSICANTPKFDIGVEKESVYTASTGDRYTAITENIDFGIVERPRQLAALNKEVSHLKVTLPNGQILIDGDPRVEDLKYVAITRNPSTKKIEDIHITIDAELIYGSQVEIKYEFTIENKGEKDYKNESYYYYGDNKDNPVKITSATLLDYVDSEMMLSEGQTETWKVLDMVKKGFNWNLTPAQEQEIIKKYNTLVKAEPINEEKAIAPGESQKTEISVQKLLSNSDELSFENNGEIVKIQKTGGRTLETNLASYAPVLLGNALAAPQEIDEAKAETVTIIPPTGNTDNTVMYAIIGIISLTILGAGIYGTRKILKK